jgi:hypothetical protein
VAEAALSGSGARLRHVRQVGARAEMIVGALGLDPHVAAAAWLHDVGYGAEVVDRGFHPLDGANWLAHRGWGPAVVGLVAYHSGAVVEAEERGLLGELQAIPAPADDELEVVDFCDMTTAPDGEPVAVEERVAEILRRYDVDSPVHRAVLRSRTDLVQSVRRVQARLASADAHVGVAEGWTR